MQNINKTNNDMSDQFYYEFMMSVFVYIGYICYYTMHICDTIYFVVLLIAYLGLKVPVIYVYYKLQHCQYCTL